MIRHLCLAVGLVATIALGHLGAHFVWVDVSMAKPGAQQVEVYFSEEAASGEPHLLEKIAGANACLRKMEAGTVITVPIKLTAITDESHSVLCAQWSGAAVGAKDLPVSIEASCEYGVFEHGPQPALLNYCAKRLLGNWSAQGDVLGKSSLACDIVPTLVGKDLRLDVLFNGKPSPKCEVVVREPQGQTQELLADASGRVQLDAVKPGRWAIRAAHIEADRGGTHQGKAYQQTWHYATLVFDVPAGPSATSETPAAASNAPSAGDLLKRARDARSMWYDFPGFSAEVTLIGSGQTVKGTATIDANGNVTLAAPKSPLSQWAEEQLQSLVQHRMPDGEVATGQVRYVDDDTDHPLGRKISLGESEMQSAYRIKDDAILEVNRSMGPQRFTISVLEIFRDANNKYLPRSFTMNFFDSASGKLVNSLGYLNDWQRVGKFELPRTILEVSTRDGRAETRQIDFANCKLLDSAAK